MHWSYVFLALFHRNMMQHHTGWETSAHQCEWKFGRTRGKQAWASGILYRLYKRLPSLGEFQRISVSQPVIAAWYKKMQHNKVRALPSPSPHPWHRSGTWQPQGAPTYSQIPALTGPQCGWRKQKYETSALGVVTAKCQLINYTLYVQGTRCLLMSWVLGVTKFINGHDN